MHSNHITVKAVYKSNVSLFVRQLAYVHAHTESTSIILSIHTYVQVPKPQP